MARLAALQAILVCSNHSYGKVEMQENAWIFSDTSICFSSSVLYHDLEVNNTRQTEEMLQLFLQIFLLSRLQRNWTLAGGTLRPCLCLRGGVFFRIYGVVEEH